ncbi:MAG: hypothetical protein HQ559_15275 [Lentisphaerae bacterium]|nr:hypothetical protein [Lentisphaerota bacterium]
MRWNHLPFRSRPAAVLLAAAIGVCAEAATTVNVKTPGFTPMPPLKAFLRINGQNGTRTFVGRMDSGDLVFFERGKRKTMRPERVEHAYFDIDPDRHAVYEHVRKENWAGAVKILLAAVRPALPYMELPGNNAADLALKAGTYMMKAARQKRDAAATDEEREASDERYKAAFSLLRYPGDAEWYEGNIIARLLRIQCLLALNKPRTASKQLTEFPEPVIGSTGYGLYWLVHAQVGLQNRDYRSSLDGAVKSLSFENKDVETFPDALLVSARCYEELQNWHRARDVYYEVARIFPGTAWASAARGRLEFIVDEGLTEEEEEKQIENVFFGQKEDMNKLVKGLLANEYNDPFAEEKKAPGPSGTEDDVDLDEEEAPAKEEN